MTAIPSEFLGVLCMYSITSGVADEPLPITREELEAAFTELKLEPGFLPAPVRGVEAFRAATSNLSDSWTSNGLKYKVSVRETDRTDDYVTRQMLASWTDADGIPQERRVADLQFFRPRRVTAGRIRGTEKLKTMLHRGLDDLDRERLDALVKKARSQYDMYVHRLTPHAMRLLVRQYLQFLGGVSLRAGAGGAYFLPLDQLEQVRVLRELVRRFGPQCRLMYTPMVDDPEQRDMIRDSVELDVEARVQSQLHDIEDWRRRNPGKTPGVTIVRSWTDEHDLLADLLVDYGDLLNVAFGRAADQLEDLKGAIDRMNGQLASGLRGH